ncbi:hypothetical protein [Bradyrhizobium sp. F1.13.3]|uniref:hypothetical protein n=1 Tax=Bradyrhizobium sp. F1.13.3 TaxID=3156351 RepID=UPI003396E894
MADQTLQSPLQSYRDAARTQCGKGTYFERFTAAYQTVSVRYHISLKTINRKATAATGDLT